MRTVLASGQSRRGVAAVAVVAALALAGVTACDATEGAANVAFTQGSDSSHPTKYCGIQDLALDQPTTASSTQGAAAYPASAATDGDPGSRWSSASSDPQWLKVDLGSPQQICRMGISWEAAYAKSYKVQVSDNDSTWTTVYSTTAGTGGDKTFAVSRTARYIRMYGTKRATQFGYSIFEFDVYGLTTTAPLTGGNGNGGNGKCPWVGSTAPVARRVQQVLDTMDRSEEVTLLSGDGTSGYIGQVPAIPSSCASAPSTWKTARTGSVTGRGRRGPRSPTASRPPPYLDDPSLIDAEGAAIGAEFAGKGVNVSLGPTTNLVRDPRWGRTYEDLRRGPVPGRPEQITAAEVEGIQSRGVMAMVQATVAAYDQEQYPNGGNNETVQPEGAARELYLAPFQAAIEKSAPAAFMCSYARVNNEGSCQNADMLQDGLDTQADSGGFVTSDWGAAGSVVADAESGMGRRDAVLHR